MEPSEAYQPIMAAMHEKIYLSKVVIELCEDEPNASYEDLLNRIEVSPCPSLMTATSFTSPPPSVRPQFLLPPSAAQASLKTLS